MRFARFRALALALAALALVAPVIPASAQNNDLVVTYRDADGPGKLTIRDLGTDAATGGHQIQVQLVQNGVTYSGSGLNYQLEASGSFVSTLITFTLVSPNGRSYFFQGKTTSGITLSGQGNYHRVGFPQQKFDWSFVLGG